MKSKEILNF